MKRIISLILIVCILSACSYSNSNETDITYSPSPSESVVYPSSDPIEETVTPVKAIIKKLKVERIEHMYKNRNEDLGDKYDDFYYITIHSYRFTSKMATRWCPGSMYPIHVENIQYCVVVQFVLMEDYEKAVKENQEAFVNQYNGSIGILGIYEKESFTEDSYIDWSEEQQLTYEDLKEDIVFSNDEIVVINFARYLEQWDCLMPNNFTDVEAEVKELLEDLLKYYVENYLLAEEDA